MEDLVPPQTQTPPGHVENLIMMDLLRRPNGASFLFFDLNCTETNSIQLIFGEGIHYQGE
jgi:hypothetical protein